MSYTNGMSLRSFNRIFDRFFPIPDFLMPRSFGVDISDESLKFLELTATRRGVEVGRHGERIIPLGIIESGTLIIVPLIFTLSSLQNSVTAPAMHVKKIEKTELLVKLLPRKNDLLT